MRRAIKVIFLSALWNLIRAILQAHTRHVRVGRAKSAEFPQNTGVPQGACSSPTLFALFFTILTTEVAHAVRDNNVDASTPPDLASWPTLRRHPDGSLYVDYGVLSVLAYADDAVLVAHNKHHAELCLQACAKALHYIGSAINVAKTWHLVNATRGRPTPQLHVYTVAAGQLQRGPPIQQTQVLSKKTGNAYLGVALTANMSFREQRKTALRKATAELRRSGAAICSHGVAHPRLGNILVHQAYSHLLFASEVWADVTHTTVYNKLKSAAAAAAARSLDVRGHPNRDAVLGELGIPSPDARVYQQRLAYWFELLLQPDTRPTRYVYNVSLACMRGPGNDEWWRDTTRAAADRIPNWARDTRHMLHTLGLDEAWAGGDPDGQLAWLMDRAQRQAIDRRTMTDHVLYTRERDVVRNLAREIVTEWAAHAWHERMAANPRTATTAKIHRRPEYARYLDARYNRDALRIRTALRTGTYGLHDDPEAEECPLCHRPGPETVPHFMLECEALATARRRLGPRMREAARTPALRALLNDEDTRADTELALALGGNLDHVPGLEDFNKPRSAAPADTVASHPATDRLRALRLSADVLVAMDSTRERLLQ